MIRIVENSFADLFAGSLSADVQEAIVARAGDAQPISVLLPLLTEQPVDLLLICPRALGLYAAVAAFGDDVDTAPLDDVHDCLCELANVVGGQLIANRFGAGDLGLPRIVSTKELESLLPATRDRWDGVIMGLDVTLHLVAPAAVQPSFAP